MPHDTIHPDSFFAFDAPTSQATVATGSRVIAVSGQGPIDGKGQLVGGDSCEEQARQALSNFKALVEAGGGRMSDVNRLTVYLLRPEDLPRVIAVRREFFAAPFPATTALYVAGLVNPAWLVEFEGTAVV